MLQGRLFPKLEKYIEAFKEQYPSIPGSRKRELEKVADFVSIRTKRGGPARLIFICTHNSRRSQMGQIWAQAAAFYNEIPDVKTYSGGTEATAFNPNAVKAMKEAGFKISSKGKKNNPVYAVSYSDEDPAMEVFSKKYNNKANPKDDFYAIMTCSDADENCPFIPGATMRIPITYQDPKVFDHTEKESEAYSERCYQIGLEMFYLFSTIKDE
jgi:arsenate reductase